jgi:hypothetical protein
MKSSPLTRVVVPPPCRGLDMFAGCKSVDGVIPMRFHAVGEIACHSYVQRSVGFACKDIDHRLLHSWSNALWALAFTPKQYVRRFSMTD